MIYETKKWHNYENWDQEVQSGNVDSEKTVHKLQKALHDACGGWDPDGFPEIPNIFFAEDGSTVYNSPPRGFSRDVGEKLTKYVLDHLGGGSDDQEMIEYGIENAFGEIDTKFYEDQNNPFLEGKRIFSFQEGDWTYEEALIITDMNGNVEEVSWTDWNS